MKTRQGALLNTDETQLESQILQPSEREVMEIISIWVNGKRAGSNGISVKMLKAGAGRLQESWAGLMREVWETERMPAEGLDPGPEWQKAIKNAVA